MLSEKQDLRVVRTHILIRSALIALLENHDYDKISVQDIVDKAMVNRATFYKYYSGKSDLAGAMIADFKSDYQNLMTKRLQTHDLQSFFDQILPFIQQNSPLVLALWKIKTKHHHLYDDMFLMIKQLFTQLAIQKFSTPAHTNEWDYHAEMFANFALYNMKYHLERDNVIPLNQVIEKLEKMIVVVKD